MGWTILIPFRGGESIASTRRLVREVGRNLAQPAARISTSVPRRNRDSLFASDRRFGEIVSGYVGCFERFGWRGSAVRSRSALSSRRCFLCLASVLSDCCRTDVVS